MTTMTKTMRRCTALLLVMSLSLMPASGLAFSRTASSDNHRVSFASTHAESQSLNESEIKRRALESFGQLPLRFEINQGQSDGSVRFLARGRGYSLFLTDTEAVLGLKKSSRDSADKSAIVSMQPVNGSPHPQVIGLNQLPGITNYLLGNDPSQWRTNVKSYEKVEYRNIWPGVNQVYYGNQGELEYDFIVAPGISPNIIRVTFPGADSLRIDQSGELVLSVCGSEIRQHAPVIYQQRNGQREIISGRYVLYTNNGRQEVGFEISKYDTSRTLVIDPVLIYSTYFGGSSFDSGESLTIDSAGNVYLTGITLSTNLPTAGAFRPGNSGGEDAFITKINALGNALTYSTYLGGNGNDEGKDIAVDSAGNVYITGLTQSTNFPTQNPSQSAYGGGPTDGFIAKLNATGNGLVYSTYHGGSDEDVSLGVSVDTANSAIVCGQTRSANFPVASAAQTTYQGSLDAFVTKFRADGSGYTFSTYLGGTDIDAALGIAVDNSSNIYVTGRTRSTAFPRISALQNAYGGSEDAFVAKFSTTGTISYSTFLGGSAGDLARNITVDSSGNAYVTGETSSTNFPTRFPIQASPKEGPQDIFITKLDAAGSSLLYSTFFGGRGSDFANGIAVDSSGRVSVTGATFSDDFPITTITAGQGGQLVSPGNGGEAFVMSLNTAGTALIFASYLGGNQDDYGLSIAVDSTGNLYVAGQAGSTTFPTVGAYQASNAGNFDAFVAKLDPTRNTAYFTTVSAASYSVNSLAVESIAAGFGASLAGATQQATAVPLPTTLSSRQVRVRDANGGERAAPLFIVVGGTAGQINFQIPQDTVIGRALVSVVDTANSSVIAAGVVNVNSYSPSIFTATGAGTGAPAAYNLRYNATLQGQLEPVFTNTLAPATINLGPATDTLILVLFPTGVRRGVANPLLPTLAEVAVRFFQGNTIISETQTAYAGASGQVGLDQINVVLPRTLIGRGDVDCVISMPGQLSQVVKLRFQ